MSKASSRDAVIAPHFRVIVIVQDGATIRRLGAFLARSSGQPIAIMLRDQEHRPEAVRLLMHTAQESIPPEYSHAIIINGCDDGIDGGSWRHLPSIEMEEISEQIIPSPAVPFGCSTHSLDQIATAESLSASYVTLSPIYATSSKPGHPGLGIEALRHACAITSMKVFAQGGMITLDRISAAVNAGAWGVSGISLGNEIGFLHEVLELFMRESA